tara:strand:- start:200 stop:1042 length:843 start_codon:yes stop_codon:yes gene_type:complete
VIVGTSHAILTVQDSAAGIHALEALGYACKFVQKQLPSHPSKGRFLANEYLTHDLTFMTASEGLPIELVNYGSVVPLASSTPSLCPVFDAPPPEHLLMDASDHNLGHCVDQAFGVTNSIAAAIRGLPNVTACFLGGANRNCGLKAIICPVADLNRALSFWSQHLGFTPAKKKPGIERLDFKSPVSAWNLSIILVQISTKKPSDPLDFPGLRGLSVICTKIQQDRHRVIDTGFCKGQTQPFATTIDGQRLFLEILELPDNLYIELLQVNPRAEFKANPQKE